MEQEKNKNNSLVAVIVILALLVLALGGYIVYDKVLNNKETPSENTANNSDNANDNPSSIGLFPIEKGYSEISLTNEEKEKINKELYTHFQPGNGVDPIISFNSAKGDVFGDDCMKLVFTKWYISKNNKAGFTYETVADKDELGNEFSKVKYSRLEEITREMFNIKKLSCNANKNDYSIGSKYGVVPDENGYVWLSPIGGGYVPVAVRTLSKYENGNNYYLLIHIFQPTGIDYDYLDKYLTSYSDESNITDLSKYIKLKYGTNGNQKYLISFEYLN